MIKIMIIYYDKKLSHRFYSIQNNEFWLIMKCHAESIFEL